MTIKDIYTLFLLIHASLGGVALTTGTIALIAQKGKRIHKLSGKLFFISMLTSATFALIIACIPGHLNPFLFSIGLFSTYLILIGYRSISYKLELLNLTFDWIISSIMVVTGLFMIFYPIVIRYEINVVLAVFGAAGVVFSIRDLMLYRNRKKLMQSWLKMHIGNMTGGYISAVTAFVVVNNILPGIYGWLAHGIIGGFFIFYWTKKISK